MLKFLCKHDWKKISEQIIPSEVDILRQMGKVPNTHSCFVRKYITDYTCNRCGSFKRYTEKTAI